VLPVSRLGSSPGTTHVYSIVTGLLTLVLLILYVTASDRSESGLVERAFVSVPFLWIGVLGYRLKRVSRPRPDPSSVRTGAKESRATRHAVAASAVD
jgi:hypothetical protein